jgi:hypothetical protein
MAIDTDRIDEATLALLLLGLHDERRAWKGFDWGVLARLHEAGLITQPAGRAKSVLLTDEGLAKARAAFDRLFVRPRD